jgi:hypothetical protein
MLWSSCMARWSKAGEAGMIEANQSEAFLRDVAERFATRRWLKIFSLRFADRIVTILLAVPRRDHDLFVF